MVHYDIVLAIPVNVNSEIKYICPFDNRNSHKCYFISMKYKRLPVYTDFSTSGLITNIFIGICASPLRCHTFNSNTLTFSYIEFVENNGCSFSLFLYLSRPADTEIRFPFSIHLLVETTGFTCYFFFFFLNSGEIFFFSNFLHLILLVV